LALVLKKDLVHVRATGVIGLDLGLENMVLVLVALSLSLEKGVVDSSKTIFPPPQYTHPTKRCPHRKCALKLYYVISHRK
jgi:hypothetical protein